MCLDVVREHRTDSSVDFQTSFQLLQGTFFTPDECMFFHCEVVFGASETPPRNRNAIKTGATSTTRPLFDQVLPIVASLVLRNSRSWNSINLEVRFGCDIASIRDFIEEKMPKQNQAERLRSRRSMEHSDFSAMENIGLCSLCIKTDLVYCEPFHSTVSLRILPLLNLHECSCIIVCRFASLADASQRAVRSTWMQT